MRPGPGRPLPLLVAAALAAGLAPPARADRITLTSGQVYEGRLLRETSAEITMEVLVQGTPVEMSVARSLVARHEKGASLQEQYAGQLARMDAGSADAQAGLAEWCRLRRMTSAAARHALEAVRLRPDHAPAGRILTELGYVFAGGRWLTEAEFQESRGMVFWAGAWRTRDEAARLRAESDEARRRADVSSLGADITRLDRRRTEILQEREGRRREADDLEHRLESLEAERARLEPRLDEARGALARALVDLARAEEQAWVISRNHIQYALLVDPYQADAGWARQAVLGLSTRLDQVKKDAADASRKLDMARAPLPRLDRELEKLAAESARLQSRMETLAPGTPTGAPSDVSPAPSADADAPNADGKPDPPGTK
jgi:hypothetical protein